MKSIKKITVEEVSAFVTLKAFSDTFRKLKSEKWRGW